MIEDPIMMGSILVAVAAFFVVGAVVLAWRANRRARPTPVIPIFDEAPADLVLKPWSETRGTYHFRAVDLPKAYLALGFADDAVLAQFGEDEDDARIALWNRLRRRSYEAGVPRFFAEALLATELKAIGFKPLTKRKDRTP